MNIPHRCPICEGRGEVGKALAQTGAILVCQKPQRFRCHGCQGTGIIWEVVFGFNNLPYIQTWNLPKIGPDGSPVVPLTVGDGVMPLTSTWGPLSDGVARCESCNEPIYMAPGSGCQRTSSHMRGN